MEFVERKVREDQLSAHLLPARGLKLSLTLQGLNTLPDLSAHLLPARGLKQYIRPTSPKLSTSFRSPTPRKGTETKHSSCLLF